jgi:hypothetical protein
MLVHGSRGYPGNERKKFRPLREIPALPAGASVRVQKGPARISDLKSQGGHFRNEMEVGPGGKQIQVEDPGGNPIELFEPAND